MYVHEDYRAGYNPALIKAAHAERKMMLAARVAEYEAKAAESKFLSMIKDRSLPFWVCDIVRDVAAEYGVFPSEVIGESRSTRPAQARRKAIYKVKECTPVLSSGQIGGWFHRDTTTVLTSIACYAYDNGTSSLGYSMEKHLRRARRPR